VWPVSRPKRFEIKQIKCPLTNGGAPSAIISQHSGTDGPLLPVLQALQETFGCVPEAAVVMVAEALNLSRAEVHGVVTFYHDFRREPAGRHVIKLCRAEACQAAGGDALAVRAQGRLGVVMGTTAPDGSVTIEPVYCLGLCATAPSAMIDGHVVGRLDETRLDAVLAPSSLPGTVGVSPAPERAGGTPAVRATFPAAVRIAMPIRSRGLVHNRRGDFMARISLIEEAEHPELGEMIARIKAGRRGGLLNVYKLLLHSPALAQTWFDHNGAVRWKTKLTGRLREIVIIRVAHLNGVDYVLAQHVPGLAVAEGVTIAECEALADWRASDLFDGRERAALAYAEAMTLSTSVADEVFADVRRHFDDREIVELSVLIGTYIMHNRVMKALAIDLEPESNRGR
jgi:NADH:ubiquinone oxidoreductase subunit E/alkylhydroperoxidase family enzyme